jgi:hypothetical protein
MIVKLRAETVGLLLRHWLGGRRAVGWHLRSCEHSTYIGQ